MYRRSLPPRWSHTISSPLASGDLVVDPPVETDDVAVPPGTSLGVIASALGSTPKDVQACNPELRAGRTPPVGEGELAYPIKVPRGKGAIVAQALAKMRGEQPLERYVVRFGETLDQVAASHKTTTQKLVELNTIAPGEAVRGGTTLLVPKVDAAAAAASVAPATLPAGKQSVVVPPDLFVYPDRKRVFYRVQAGDTLREIASVLRVPADDLHRWNDLDPGARLAEGMTLQASRGAGRGPVARRRALGERGTRASRRVRGVLRRARA